MAGLSVRTPKLDRLETDGRVSPCTASPCMVPARTYMPSTLATSSWRSPPRFADATQNPSQSH